MYVLDESIICSREIHKKMKIQNHQIQCLKMASIDNTTEAPITATELETDLAAPASGPCTGAGDKSWAVAAAKKSATIRAMTKDLKEVAWNAIVNKKDDNWVNM